MAGHIIIQVPQVDGRLSKIREAFDEKKVECCCRRTQIRHHGNQVTIHVFPRRWNACRAQVQSARNWLHDLGIHTDIRHEEPRTNRRSLRPARNVVETSFSTI